MFKSLQNRLKQAGQWLPLALLPFAAQAQTPGYSVSNAANVATTYTDISSTGTPIATANTDDANSAAQAIGFTFNFNGTAFTSFVLNTNGFIRLGLAPPSSASLFYPAPQAATGGPISSTNAADVNLIMPFAVDLAAGTGTPTGYQVATAGAVGSRVTTIQWTNVQDKVSTIATQLLNFSFQVKLYETGQIEFVYGPTTPNTVGNDFHFVAVGIKGSSAAQSITATKGSGQLWSAATFAAGDYTGNAHNIRQAVPADPGRTYRFLPTFANDAAVGQIYTLTKLPIPQGAPHAVRAFIRNNGTTPQANLSVTLTVTGATTFSDVRVIPALAAGASAVVTFNAYTPAAAGTNTVTVSVPADNNSANNTQNSPQVVSATDYSYLDATAAASARGFGPSATLVSAFLTRFSASTASNVTQVRAKLVNFVTAPSATQDVTIGKTVFAVVMNATTGAVLGRSADYVVTAADVNGTALTPFTLTTPVAVPAGDFLVGLAQTYQTGQTVQYFPLGTQNEAPSRTEAYYTSSVSTPGAPVDVTSAAPADYRFMLEAVTVATGPAPCPPPTGLAASAVTSNSASISFTAPASTSGYVVTYTAQGSTTTTTVTPAPSASPFTLTGLLPSTTYTVRISSSCPGSTVAGTATTTFTTLLPPVTYAAMPYNEGFEGTWINGLGTRDVPTVNWRNTPVTGDNSWRREDDGFASAAGSFLGAETGTTPPYPIRSSVGAHSARFHSYGAADGQIGRFDLYVNMATPGSKRLGFDYINKTGTDKLEVFVSTDGGATFSTTPVLISTLNTVFAAKTALISSNSATTVVRFQATSDFGDDDIGIDNLSLVVLSSTTNSALAATVSLYPNPAHQSFKLTVPAGSLHAASATLINALGQVVQQRQLNLPVAGGTADFNVSGLAAGVYSLQLRSGDDLIVKRVVVE